MARAGVALPAQILSKRHSKHQVNKTLISCPHAKEPRVFRVRSSSFLLNTQLCPSFFVGSSNLCVVCIRYHRRFHVGRWPKALRASATNLPTFHPCTNDSEKSARPQKKIFDSVTGASQGFLFTLLISSGVRHICSPWIDCMFVSTAKP
jgi:hypothetical protein